jgi:hypothetical protein
MIVRFEEVKMFATGVSEIRILNLYEALFAKNIHTELSVMIKDVVWTRTVIRRQSPFGEKCILFVS